MVSVSDTCAICAKKKRILRSIEFAIEFASALNSSNIAKAQAQPEWIGIISSLGVTVREHMAKKQLASHGQSPSCTTSRY